MIRWIALFLSLFLAACAGPAPKQAPAGPEALWSSHRAALDSLLAWQLAGRIAVVSEDDAWHGSIRWRHESETDDVMLSAPLIGGGVQLHSDPSGVVLRAQDGAVFYDKDGERLLLQHLGVRVPVSELRYWVLGLPEPSVPVLSGFDAGGRMEWLEQAGWRVEFLRYETVGERQLPTKVFVSNHRLRVRLVVDRWDV